MNELIAAPQQRKQTDEALNTARHAAYRAVGLNGTEVACCRYDRALAAAFQSLAEQGYQLVPPAGPDGDAATTEECTCLGGVSHRQGCPQWVLPY